MICKLEIYNGELNIFPVVTNERVFAQITMGNIVKGEPGKSPIIGENNNWWVYNNETGEYEDTGKVATTSDDVVKYVEAKDEQHPNRLAIQLKNGDLITGVAKKEGLGSVNIAMVNEWDVVDLGTSELPINMNTPKGVRPTVQEAGQTGEEANKIAYLSDLENVGGDIEVIKLSEWFNESPSVLIEQTWIFPEENAKLFKALEDKKTIILALYNGSNPSSPYNSLKTVYGKLSINHISDTKIEITVENLPVWQNKMYVESLKLGPFDKDETDFYIVNANSGLETTSITLDKSGTGTKFLNDSGKYSELPSSDSGILLPGTLGDLMGEVPSSKSISEFLTEQLGPFNNLYKNVMDGKTFFINLGDVENLSISYPNSENHAIIPVIISIPVPKSTGSNIPLALVTNIGNVQYHISMYCKPDLSGYQDSINKYTSQALSVGSVVDNLHSYEKTVPLSANQGRILGAGLQMVTPIVIEANYEVGGDPTSQNGGTRSITQENLITLVSTLTQAGFTLPQILNNVVLQYQVSSSNTYKYQLKCSHLEYIEGSEPTYHLYFPVMGVISNNPNKLGISIVNKLTLLLPAPEVGWVIGGDIQVFQEP